MLRHAIAPARFFSQVPNEIIRHPRLGSDAVRLLLWQLSLAPGADEPLSESARRAGVKKSGFQRAKEELKAEGFLHEWREQKVRGRWGTVQLVSNVPLTAEEAVLVRDGVPPTDVPPAVGQPTRRVVGRYPEQTDQDNTPQPPAPEAARRIVEELELLDPRLRVPRGMLAELAGLAGEWLGCGHTEGGVREAIRRGMPGREVAVRHPGGLVRYVLREVPPVPSADIQLPPRVAQMVECAGDHTQSLLFQPVADEDRCGVCRQGQAEAAGSGSTAARGAAAARAAMRGWVPA
ncbi:hypothetical protein [Streptomyces sp. NBC_01465]|uniref:hypothetical protein n=1 Tax=Streptomyces sp. NBC_01465 TaxID=2903878 RepID=UPI002E333791|nr:hypothetical protein [Streptomyces sp. NBC_01465]